MLILFDFVNDLAKEMERKLSRSGEVNAARKQKLASSKKQQTLFECFHHLDVGDQATRASTSTELQDSDLNIVDNIQIHINFCILLILKYCNTMQPHFFV